VAGPSERWLTAEEAVAYLGLPSRKALYQAVRRGQLPVHRLGKRRMRFSRAELDLTLLGVGGEE
jgi:excisionase family DNA binding protein